MVGVMIVERRRRIARSRLRVHRAHHDHGTLTKERRRAALAPGRTRDSFADLVTIDGGKIFPAMVPKDTALAAIYTDSVLHMTRAWKFKAGVK